MFKRLVATSRAPQIMVLSMLRSFGKIGPQIDQIWAWLSRGYRWSPGVRNPLKSSVTGPSLLVNCYLEIKFHKIIRVNPPPLNEFAAHGVLKDTLHDKRTPKDVLHINVRGYFILVRLIKQAIFSVKKVRKRQQQADCTLMLSDLHSYV